MTDNSGCFLPKKHVGSPCVENLIRLGRQLEACASEIMLTIESLSDLDVHLDYRANAQRLKTLNDEFNTLMNNLTQAQEQHMKQMTTMYQGKLDTYNKVQQRIAKEIDELTESMKEIEFVTKLYAIVTTYKENPEQYESDSSTGNNNDGGEGGDIAISEDSHKLTKKFAWIMNADKVVYDEWQRMSNELVVVRKEAIAHYQEYLEFLEGDIVKSYRTYKAIITENGRKLRWYMSILRLSINVQLNLTELVNIQQNLRRIRGQERLRVVGGRAWEYVSTGFNLLCSAFVY